MPLPDNWAIFFLLDKYVVHLETISNRKDDVKNSQNSDLYF